jgi:deoxyribodipyrimidine photo-lyase
MRGLVWFKDDLRIHDNPALYQAARQCDGIVAVYILDPGMWKQHSTSACRVDFVLRGLKELKTHLEKLNIPFILHPVKNTSAIPAVLLKLAKAAQAEALFYNQQYEVNEHRRDLAVTAIFEKNNYEVFSFHDQVILPPGSVKTKSGKYFSVFTPFKRAWITAFKQQDIKALPAPRTQAKLSLKIKSLPIPASLPGFKSTVDAKLWPSGETAAKKRLQTFLTKHLFNYKKERDYPALDSTSKLSAYLAAGMISSRQCFLAAMAHNHNEIDSGNLGAMTWLSELIWREFYRCVMVAVPRVSMHKAYQIATDKMHWDFNEKQFQAWQQGKTGYPLIDAAMRQLNTIGWMHNRLRMVVAMFLTKNLFFDWRHGEKYFIENLIDGDLASNNGGWQWSASTGTDAAPYFRIFNPITQSKNYDPEGQFILKYCPELAGLNKKSLHEPYKYEPEKSAKQGYPKPIIELNQKREKVLKAYKNAR